MLVSAQYVRPVSASGKQAVDTRRELTGDESDYERGQDRLSCQPQPHEDGVHSWVIKHSPNVAYASPHKRLCEIFCSTT
jgi:hypothetical protein